MSFIDRLVTVLASPIPLRALIVRKLLRSIPIGSYPARLHAAAVQRPAYGWCMYHAAVEAAALGHKAMTVIELGVAGGNGLVSLCLHREEVQRAVGIQIEVVGFDTGRGLPKTDDPRDLLYLWPEGSFEMDRVELERRLAGRAQLVFGDVAETLDNWSPRPDAPLGAVMFDLDFYTSTATALELLTKENILPRIWCYMDDISGYPDNAYTDSIGEREAIKQFNLQPERTLLKDHLSPAYTFRGLPPEGWHEQIYLYHRLTHSDYNRCLSTTKHQLELVTR